MHVAHAIAPAPELEVLELLAELALDPLGRRLDDPDAIRAGIPDWHPRNDDDDDTGTGDDDDDDAGGDDDDDSDGDGDDATGSGDDDDAAKGGTEIERARRALAAKNRELKALKDADRKRRDAEDKKAGKHKERADRLERELEELRGKETERDRRSLIEAAAKKAGAKNPATVYKLLKADGKTSDLDVDDDVEARRLVRDLLKEDADLKATGRRSARANDDDDRRNSRTRGRDDDDDEDEDDDEDDRPRRRRSKKDEPVGPARLRRHFGETDKRRRARK